VATLYLVSTPIGNLGDLSSRAAQVLGSVDRILAEDTRRTRVLTDHVGVGVQLVSLHAHNEAERTARVLEWLDEGENLALVSDAGTPLVSDPGGRLVEAVWERGHSVVPIPGASAVLAALAASGLPAERFTFLGFPERKGKGRVDLLDRVSRSQETVILFESPRRLVPLLGALAEVCGPGRRVAVARELTKIHEEFVRGTLEEVSRYYSEHPARGEVTVVIAPAEADLEDDERRAEGGRALARELLSEGMTPSRVAKEVSRRFGVPRNSAYRIVHQLEDG
jgi:16S rRNA (cytidine1402-2'-O)-methyltransferase